MTFHPPDFGRMRADLMRHVDAERHRRRLRRRVSLFVGGGLVIALATGATVIALASPELREKAAYCYEDTSDSSRVQPVGDPSADATDRVERALSLCASVWRAGILGTHDDGTRPDDGRVYPVPELFACLQRDGTLAVFPAREGVTCAALGRESAP